MRFITKLTICLIILSWFMVFSKTNDDHSYPNNNNNNTIINQNNNNNISTINNINKNNNNIHNIDSTNNNNNSVYNTFAADVHKKYKNIAEYQHFITPLLFNFLTR